MIFSLSPLCRRLLVGGAVCSAATLTTSAILVCYWLPSSRRTNGTARTSSAITTSSPSTRWERSKSSPSPGWVRLSEVGLWLVAGCHVTFWFSCSFNTDVGICVNMCVSLYTGLQNNVLVTGFVCFVLAPPSQPCEAGHLAPPLEILLRQQD